MLSFAIYGQGVGDFFPGQHVALEGAKHLEQRVPGRQPTHVRSAILQRNLPCCLTHHRVPDLSRPRRCGAKETSHAKDAVKTEAVWCEGDGLRMQSRPRQCGARETG